MFDEPRDRALMLRMAEGDRAACEALYEAYAGVIGGFLYRMLQDGSLTEDCLQETFLRAWRSAPRWRQTGKVSTYLFQIAKNAALDARSRRTREQNRSSGADGSPGAAAEVADGGPGPERRLEGAELRALVRQAVEELPVDQRVVLELIQTEGMTYRAAADVLGLPLGTVKSRMALAADNLRRRLARHVRA